MEFYATINVKKYDSLELVKQAPIIENFQIEEGPYYKEKTVDDLLKKYGCYGDNFVINKTKGAIFVRKWEQRTKTIWTVCDFIILRFKRVDFS